MVQPKYSPEEALQRVKLMMNYDLSKTSVENTKIIKEQTQTSSDTLSCVKNYYTSKNIKFEELKTSSGGKLVYVNFANSSISWVFLEILGGGVNWIEYTNGNPAKPGIGGNGNWKCDGNSNFIIEKDNRSIYKSTQPTTTQPVAQPTQSTTQPVQSKPTDVRRGKERLLKQPLKDDSVSVLNCRKQIDDLYDAWVQRNSSTPETKAAVPKIRDIVQACYDQHKGKFMLGKDADNKLIILSGRNTKVGGPLENGSTAIYRIKGN
jgi:hypothetical protein